MSSISFRKPEFRLYLGYPEIVLTRAGRTLGVVAAEAPDLHAALKRLAEAVAQARGRLVVILPEFEVWRGRLDLSGRDRGERRASARTIVAGRLGAAPDDVTVALGAREAGGSFPVAGVRRSTLLQTRSMMAGLGLRPSAIVGAGTFAGFATAPRLGGWPWRLPALPRHRRGLAGALGAGALACLALLVIDRPVQPAPAPTAAVAALKPVLAVAEAPSFDTAAVTQAVPPVQPQPLGLRYAERPKPRPATVPPPMVTVATRSMPDDLPLTVAEQRRAPVPPLRRVAEMTTAGVRAIDAALPAPLRRPAAKPAPEPADVTEIARTAMPALPAPAVTSSLRPKPRPVASAAPAAAAVPAAEPAPAAERAALSPRPRDRAVAPPAAVLVASLDPAPFVEASLAAATVGTTAAVLASPPPARPAGLTAKAAPKPKPAVARAAPAVRKPAVVVAKAAPAVVVRPTPVPVQQYVRQVTPQRQVPVRQASATPRPKVVSTAALVQQRPAAKPVAQPAPVRQKVVAKPAPVRKAAKPAPVRTVAKPVAPQKVAVAQKPAKQQVGLSRRTVSLVGVFGGADGRSALVRLPNGKIEKVKAGDRIQGVQVAAISADSVRLTGRGKDTLLRLPD